MAILKRSADLIKSAGNAPIFIKAWKIRLHALTSRNVITVMKIILLLIRIALNINFKGIF